MGLISRASLLQPLSAASVVAFFISRCSLLSFPCSFWFASDFVLPPLLAAFGVSPLIVSPLCPASLTLLRAAIWGQPSVLVCTAVLEPARFRSTRRAATVPYPPRGLGRRHSFPQVVTELADKSARYFKT